VRLAALILSLCALAGPAEQRRPAVLIVDVENVRLAVRPDGAVVGRVREPLARAAEIAYRPGGGAVAYTRIDARGGEHIFVRVGSTQPRELVRRPGTESQPSWSPDGKRIAFARRLGQRSSIWVVDEDGVRLTRVTRGPEDSTPDWSPDGKALVFRRTIPNLRTTLWVVRLGGAALELTPGEMRAGPPAWHPRRAWIAFATQARETLDIEVIRADGSGREPLVSTGSAEGAPAWSPDGSMLAFTRAVPNPRGYTAATYVTSPEREVLVGGKHVTFIAWRPAG
jgi:TolB protein